MTQNFSIPSRASNEWELAPQTTFRGHLQRLVELDIFIYGLQGTARSYESEEEK